MFDFDMLIIKITHFFSLTGWQIITRLTDIVDIGNNILVTRFVVTYPVWGRYFWTKPVHFLVRFVRQFYIEFYS